MLKWQCKRLHIKSNRPLCEIFARRPDTYLICKDCPKCPTNLENKKKLRVPTDISDDLRYLQLQDFIGFICLLNTHKKLLRIRDDVLTRRTLQKRQK